MKRYSNPDPNGRPLIDCLGCGERKEHHAKGLCIKCYKNKHWKPKSIICKSCGRERPHKAFGLCGGCHTRLHHYEKILRYNAKKYHNIEYELLKQITKSCVACGFEKMVELHHIDGDKNNNDQKNLVGLCPNCHKLIHSYEYFEEIKQKLAKKGHSVTNIHPSNYANRRQNS